METVIAIKYVNVIEKTDDHDLIQITKHFPKRDIQALSEDKVAEHKAVINCIYWLLGSEDWWLEHEENGAPVLFVGGILGNIAVSISHAIDQVNDHKRLAYAAVILREEETQGKSRIGVDLVIKGDPRLNRIAGRVMGKEEIEDGRFEEIWACKEAMFKAFGPGLDFIKDLKVEFISDDLLKGMGKLWEVKREENVVVVLGPV